MIELDEKDFWLILILIVGVVAGSRFLFINSNPIFDELCKLNEVSIRNIQSQARIINEMCEDAIWKKRDV